jgi:hypothetical protein
VQGGEAPAVTYHRRFIERGVEDELGVARGFIRGFAIPAEKESGGNCADPARIGNTPEGRRAIEISVEDEAKFY